MQTIKTGVVVALLLAVSYGAFVALNSPDPDLPTSIEDWASGEENLEELIGMDVAEFDAAMESTQAISPEELMAGLAQEPAGVIASAENALSEMELPELNMPELSTPSSAAQMTTSQEDPQASRFPEPQDFPVLERFPALNPSGAVASSEQADITIPQVSEIPSGATQNTPPTSLIPADFGQINQFASHSKEVQPAQPNIEATPDNAAPNRGDANFATPSEPFSIARVKALELAGNGELEAALVMLTPYFSSLELGSSESEDLVNILDALSREVIYSRKHYLNQAHVTRSLDNISTVAQQYNMTPELLTSLNGLGQARALVPGTELKVVEGPFRASVSISRKELTLYLRNMYAGRFPISLGSDPQPRTGVFEIVNRQRDRTYYGAGTVIPGDDPRNPYGGFWLNLGDEQCIHSTATTESSELSNAGCISLAPLDAKDVFNILSIGSQVIIEE